MRGLFIYVMYRRIHRSRSGVRVTGASIRGHAGDRLKLSEAEVSSLRFGRNNRQKSRHYFLILFSLLNYSRCDHWTVLSEGHSMEQQWSPVFEFPLAQGNYERKVKAVFFSIKWDSEGLWGRREKEMGWTGMGKEWKEFEFEKGADFCISSVPVWVIFLYPSPPRLLIKLSQQICLWLLSHVAGWLLGYTGMAKYSLEVGSWKSCVHLGKVYYTQMISPTVDEVDISM